MPEQTSGINIYIQKSGKKIDTKSLSVQFVHNWNLYCRNAVGCNERFCAIALVTLSFWYHLCRDCTHSMTQKIPIAPTTIMSMMNIDLFHTIPNWQTSSWIKSNDDCSVMFLNQGCQISHPNWVSLSPNRIIRSRSVHIGSTSQNVLIVILKSPRFVPLIVSNITQFV